MKKQSREVKENVKKQMRDQEIILVLENIQYATNVASIFRTADAAGVSRIFLTGISKTPPFGKDLTKTSRGKERSMQWKYFENSHKAVKELKHKEFKLIAVEFTENSQDLSRLPYIVAGHKKIAFIFGSEVYGVTKATLAECDEVVNIPAYGKSGSLNVSTTAGIILYNF